MARSSFVLEQFEVVCDHSDHHFSNSGGDEDDYGNYMKNYKEIMREWKILQIGLPDSIYVRAYETRVDLMRAAIIGAAGHDGLFFFFDIKFPVDYPNSPPKVCYRTRSWLFHTTRKMTYSNGIIGNGDLLLLLLFTLESNRMFSVTEDSDAIDNLVQNSDGWTHPLLFCAHVD